MRRFVGSVSVYILSVFCIANISYAQEERPAFDALEPELQSIVNSWLDLNCGIDLQNQLIDKIGLRNTELEAAFVEAFELGPQVPLVEQYRANLEIEYNLFKAWLEEFGRQELSESDFNRLNEISRQDYIDNELDSFATAYRGGAVDALGYVGTSTAFDFLRSLTLLTGPDDSEYAEIARTALQRARID